MNSWNHTACRRRPGFHPKRLTSLIPQVTLLLDCVKRNCRHRCWRATCVAFTRNNFSSNALRGNLVCNQPCFRPSGDRSTEKKMYSEEPSKNYSCVRVINTMLVGFQRTSTFCLEDHATLHAKILPSKPVMILSTIEGERKSVRIIFITKAIQWCSTPHADLDCHHLCI